MAPSAANNGATGRLGSRQLQDIADMETRTNRSIIIDDVETDASLAKCLGQDQSPLFRLMPREIRELTWTFATVSYNDDRHRYAENEYYYRPGHTARLKTNTQLLLTCRRIWLEANALPMLQAEHCFWYHRAAPDARNKDWMAQLTTANLKNLGHVHLFAQMFAIEGLRDKPGELRNYFFPRGLASHHVFQPRMVTTTIRHTDWWFWESENDLVFKDSWFEAMLNGPDLRRTQTLRLELETLDYKVRQLWPIVERLESLQSRVYHTHDVSGKAVSTQFVLQKERETFDWSGPTNISNQSFEQYKEKDRLHYHVVILTWKLTFPEMPHAHVPTLRLAPAARHTQIWPGSAELERYEHSKNQLWQMKFAAADTEERRYFARPLRRRDRKKLRSSRVATRKPHLLDFLDAGLKVRMHSVNVANDVESATRKRWMGTMEKFEMGELDARWKSEGCLLRFAD